jgi:heme A synthase
MNKTLTYIAYAFIGLLTLLAGVGIVKVLIHIAVEMLGLIFNYPLQGFLISLAVTVLLFLIPDRK